MSKILIDEAIVKLVLGALEAATRYGAGGFEDAKDALREALAEQPAQQEPVATLWQHGRTGRTRITMPGDITNCDADWFKAADLYTSPQPAQRKPLTDEQFRSIKENLSRQEGWDGDGWDLALKEAIEAAHGIKGDA